MEDLFPPVHAFSRHNCLITLGKRAVITAVRKPVGEADLLTFKTQRTWHSPSFSSSRQSVCAHFQSLFDMLWAELLGQNVHWAVQRVMFYRSQAGIRVWPAKSNTSVWGDVGSPSAEMQCRETKHKSINVVKVLKTKVKGSINISRYDLWRTKRGVRDFKKTGEVTWKAAAQHGDSTNQSLCWLSSKWFGFQASWNREAGNSPGNVKGLGVSGVCLSAEVLSLSPQLL